MTGKHGFYRAVGKRALDLLLASLALVLLAPLLAIIALLVRIKLGAPILFRQMRAGAHCAPFELVKFRTMREARDARGQPLADAERATPIGNFLRSTSLDELPQLVNVLRGEMSLVGPRPLLIEYLPRYSAKQMRRHEVKPGMAGWTVINGRNALSWEQKFALDLWYVEHESLTLDLKILARTCITIFTHRPTKQSVKEFLGDSA